MEKDKRAKQNKNLKKEEEKNDKDTPYSIDSEMFANIRLFILSSSGEYTN